MSAWITILDDIIDSITNDEYMNDIRLPSENQLAKEYGVTRHDVRKAYERLTDMGFIYSAKGKGRYFKLKHDKIELVLSADVSFTEKMKKQGYDLETVNVGFAKLHKAEKIKHRMGLEPEDGLYKVSRLRYIDGEPAAIHISYVSDKIFPNIAVDGPYILSIFDYYRSNGFTDYYSSKAELQTALPTKDERDLLHCPSLTPIMILNSTCYDSETDDLLEVSKIIYRGDRFICRFKNEEI